MDRIDTLIEDLNNLLPRYSNDLGKESAQRNIFTKKDLIGYYRFLKTVFKYIKYNINESKEVAWSVNEKSVSLWTNQNGEKFLNIELHPNHKVKVYFRQLFKRLDSVNDFLKVTPSNRTFAYTENIPFRYFQNWKHIILDSYRQVKKAEEKGYKNLNIPIWERQNEKKSPSLAEPFNRIFKNREEAYWFFDLLKETVESLGVTLPDDDRLAVTLTRNNKKIRLNYCRWAIIDIRCKGTSENRLIKIALAGEGILDTEDVSYDFSQNPEERDIKLYKIPLKRFKKHENDYRRIFTNTLPFIKNRFRTYNSTQVTGHSIELAKGIFKKEYLDFLLENGLELETKGPSYWKISAGKGGKLLEKWKRDNIIAINYPKVTNPYGDITKQSNGIINKQFNFFIDDMDIDDIILAYKEGNVLIGKILSDYKFNKDLLGNFPHRRKVEWLTDDLIDVKKYSSDLYDGISFNSTIIPIENREWIEIIKEDMLNGCLDALVANEGNIPTVDFNQSMQINSLHFPDKATIISQIESALKSGKHIILTGPPGTGKSKLAKEICQSFNGENYKMVTATSDWSTFDTIGGYRPDTDGSLQFTNGIFLNCFKDNLTDKPENQWLIIDEINRADIDKAFGSLFSALTGDPITLSFKADNGQNVLVRPQKEDEVEVEPNSHEYIIPDDWRLIATMNTFDKTSLYEMSYAFMRRFAFIPVGIPKEITPQLVDQYITIWEGKGDIDHAYSENLARLWELVNEYRKVGPAIVQDLYSHLKYNGGRDYASAVIMYILPQFEGMMEHKLTEFYKKFSNSLGFIENKERIKSFIEDFFEVDVDGNE